jgi:hypothetical protein
MKHLLNDLSEEEKNNIREQHAGGMKVSNARFKTLLETKSGDVKPLVEQFEEDDYDFGFESPSCPSCKGNGCEECDGSGMKRNSVVNNDDKELYRGSPERLVKHMDSGEIVGTHKDGVGYTPNEFGKSLGHSSHPTSIPDYTKFDDDEMNDTISSRLSQPERRTQRGSSLDEKYSIREQGTTPTLSADYVSTRKVDDETVLKIRNLIIKEYVISDSEVKKSVGRCIGYLCRTEQRGSDGVIYPQSLDKRLESYERCRRKNTNATQFLPPAKVVEVLKTIM